MSLRSSLLHLLIIAGVITASASAQAGAGQEPGSTVFSGSLGLATPTGDIKKTTGIGFGGFMHVARFVSARLALSGTFGILYHMEKNSSQLTELPLLAGWNYYPGSNHGLLLFAQVGLVQVRSSVDLEIARFTESKAKFGSQVGAGVALGAGMLRASLMMPSVPDASDGFLVLASYELSIVEN